MNFLNHLFKAPAQAKKAMLSAGEIAGMLKTSPEALEAFEKAYAAATFSSGLPENLFDINAKQMAAVKEGMYSNCPEAGFLAERIIMELVAQTQVLCCSNGRLTIEDYTHILDDVPQHSPVIKEELMAVPEEHRPQLTGSLVHVDIPDSGRMLMTELHEMQKEENPVRKKHLYDIFRQGLDILDLDSLTYHIIDRNPISMGYWLPRIVAPVYSNGFFKIPDTKIIKVPLTLLQLTRNDYFQLNRTTLDIVDEYCYRVFGLNTAKDYFIKTGTYSSKFDFRNARVTGPKEVHELGEYLLFIHWQALQMAHYDLSGRKQPCIYGVSTTTEWVVREYIRDVENNPVIYHGLPLHTEYRVFVDFDTDEVLGIHNYWDPEVMLPTFERKAKSGDPDAVHDYLTYMANADRLVARYEAHRDIIVQRMKEILPDIEISGQWSVDVMQNGDDFYIIDMATAERSAFYKETVPPELRRPSEENWIPDLSNH